MVLFLLLFREPASHWFQGHRVRAGPWWLHRAEVTGWQPEIKGDHWGASQGGSVHPRWIRLYQEPPSGWGLRLHQERDGLRQVPGYTHLPQKHHILTGPIACKGAKWGCWLWVCLLVRPLPSLLRAGLMLRDAVSLTGHQADILRKSRQRKHVHVMGISRDRKTESRENVCMQERKIIPSPSQTHL